MFAVAHYEHYELVLAELTDVSAALSASSFPKRPSTFCSSLPQCHVVHCMRPCMTQKFTSQSKLRQLSWFNTLSGSSSLGWRQNTVVVRHAVCHIAHSLSITLNEHHLDL